MSKYYFDKNFGNYLPTDEEAVIVGTCQHCGGEIYEGETIYEDNDGQLFCSSDCVVDYFTTSKTAEIQEQDYE